MAITRGSTVREELIRRREKKRVNWERLIGLIKDRHIHEAAFHNSN